MIFPSYVAAVVVIPTVLAWCWLSVDAQAELVVISSNITVDSGEGALLLCVGYSPSNATITMTWSRRGQPIYNSSSIVLLEEDLVQGGRTFKQLYLQLCNLQYFDSGDYTCSVSNGTHFTEGTLQLEVNGFAQVVVISNDTEAEREGSTLLICTGYTQPPNSSNITWTKDGQVFTNSSRISTWEEDTTQGGRQFKTSFLALCELQHSDSGQYTCTVNNGEFSANSTTNLYVPDDAVEIVVISNETTAEVGGSVLLICVAFGRPEAMVSLNWYKRDQMIANSININVTTEDIIQGGRNFTQSFLQICDLNYGDTATYTCSVGNGVILVNSTVELFISSKFNRGSNSIRDTCANGQTSREAIFLDVLQFLSQDKGLNLLGLTRDYAATSCDQIARNAPHRATGVYWIQRNGTLTQEQCMF